MGREDSNTGLACAPSGHFVRCPSSADFKPAGYTDLEGYVPDSPDLHPFVFRPNHWRVVGNVKCLLKLRHVLKRSIYAKLRRRMRIGGESQLLVFVANLRPPNRGERHEEALFRREAVDLFVALLWMFVQRFLQRGVGEFDSADISDVFALGELAIDVLTRQRLVSVVLLYDRTRTLLKFCGGFRRPPVTQIACGIELPSLIVKAVRHFMADHGANRAVVYCVVSVGVEERWLQNAGREHDLI